MAPIPMILSDLESHFGCFKSFLLQYLRKCSTC